MTLTGNMGGVLIGNVISMGGTMYSTCSFEMPNILLPYTLSDFSKE